LLEQPDVLRITVETTSEGPVLRVEGRLAGPWVDELSRACQGNGSRRLELQGLQSVDLAGRQLLRRLAQDGTELLDLSGYLAALLSGDE
jgi:hypothetical protein